MADRSVLVRLRANVSQFVAQTKLAEAAVKSLHNEIDKSNDRTAWLAQGILALAPAVTTLGAGAVPVISGLATYLTLAAGAAVTMGLAFNGVGDAMGALNDYQLEPTSANLGKLNESMAKIGTDGEEFVRFLDSLGPAFAELSNSARGPMFAGMTDGLRDFMDLMPQLNVVVGEMSSAIGELSADAGAGLSGDRFAGFFEYLESDARPLLLDMGHILGNFTDGILEMMVAFGPLTEDFSQGLLKMSQSFADWSHNLESSAGFQEFLDYVRSAGPQALDFFGSLVMALVELAEAAAPIGSVMLPALTGLLDIVGGLADTPLGPLVLGFTALTAAWGRLNAIAAITGSGALAMATRGIRENVSAARTAVPSMSQFGSAMLYSAHSQDTLTRSMESGSAASRRAATTALNARGQVAAFGRSVAPVAGQAALLALAMSDVDNKMGLTNTTTLALAGSLAGPWGAAVGAGAGLLLDLNAGGEKAVEALTRLDEVAASGNLVQLSADLQKSKDELEDYNNLDMSGFLGLGDVAQRVAVSFDEVFSGEFVNRADQHAAAIERNTLAFAGLRIGSAASDLFSFGTIMDAAGAKVEGFRNQLEGLNDVLAGRATMRDYEGAIDDFTAAIKKNGNSFDINTAKGRENQGMLDKIASSALDMAGQMGEVDRQKFLSTAIQDLRSMGKAMGVPKSEVNTLIDLLKKANSTKASPKVDLVGGGAAAGALAGIMGQLNAIDGRRAVATAEIITTKINRVFNSVMPGGLRNADGNVVDFYADGGVAENHVAQIAPAGAWRVWAEPETGGEAYIPLADSKRERSIDIWEEVGSRLGVQFARFADGGTTGGKKKKPSLELTEWENPEDARRLDARQARLERALDILTKTVDANSENLDHAASVIGNATEAYDAIAAKMDQAGQASVAGFRTGLFDKQEIPGDSDVWSAGARGPRTTGGWFENLTGDIAGLEERGRLQSQLSLAGLSKEALAAALAEGTNEDLAGLLASGRAAEFQMLYDTRATHTAFVKDLAGQLTFGAELEPVTAELRVLQDQFAGLAAQMAKSEEARLAGEQRLAALTGAAAGAAVSEGTVAGYQQRNNQTGQRANRGGKRGGRR